MDDMLWRFAFMFLCWGVIIWITFRIADCVPAHVQKHRFRDNTADKPDLFLFETADSPFLLDHDPSRPYDGTFTLITRSM